MKCPIVGIVESTSSRKASHQVEGWGCHPPVKNSDPELVLSERTAGTKMEKSLRKGGPVTGLKLGYSSGGGPKA